MERQNLILVFNPGMSKILVCKRKKPHYSGLYNLVGGKAKENESPLEAAYRELEEETAIHQKDIKLLHLMDMAYHLHGRVLEVFAGRFNSNDSVKSEETPVILAPYSGFP